jgi:putative phosphoesterase
MKLGIISDTHIPGGAPEVPAQVIKAFKGVDLILHAGNIYTSGVLDWLEEIAPVKAVGSMDGDRREHPLGFNMEGNGDPRIGKQQILDIEGHTIGLVNNLEMRGMSDEIKPGFIESQTFRHRSLTEMVHEFFGQPVDIVVFGRTHHSMIEEHDNILFLNPGSPTLPKNLIRLGSVAILDLTSKTKSATLVELSELA